ncbi:MAG: transporter substrate-binding domain-containing protein, partial [Achromobacter sp.]|nr:transporter substrate-binding domain-containing protein [Achromobacter sp.]
AGQQAVVLEDAPAFLMALAQRLDRLEILRVDLTASRALAQRWGAVVRTYRVPSDALVAVREGSCDIGLVDDAVWEPLMRFPEWKKFSSTLSADGDRHERVWLLRADDSASRGWLDQQMRDWNRAGAWKAMTVKWARDVAFDVYLDQEVPDCHG